MCRMSSLKELLWWPADSVLEVLNGTLPKTILDANMDQACFVAIQDNDVCLYKMIELMIEFGSRYLEIHWFIHGCIM